MILTRRQLLASTLAGAAVDSGRTLAAAALKVVVTGGHPGDPECGCAGTMARFAALGHQLVCLYLNRGEGYCKGSDPSQCGTIRTAEAEKACRILNARAIFAGQVDGQAIVDNAHYDAGYRLLDAEKPDVIFAQWPIDKHRDHRALSQLVLDAWLKLGKQAAFYYYEVADDTMMFSPAEYVDISAPQIEALRHAACYAHESQDPAKWYPHQVDLTKFRGSQSGHPQAEAFLRHWESRRSLLPGGEEISK